jgi:hypothetical protein
MTPLANTRIQRLVKKDTNIQASQQAEKPLPKSGFTKIVIAGLPPPLSSG